MDRISLSVPADPVFRPTLRLVVGGIGSRLQLSYEQVNELQLAVEALVSHRVPAATDVRIDADVGERAVSVTLGPFVRDEDGAGRRVVERLVNRVRVVRVDDESEWLELTVGDGDVTA